MLSELWSDVRYRLRSLFRRGELERELDEELEYHLAREAEAYVAAGLSPEEARRRAALAFGGVDRAKEMSREGRGTLLVETLVRDARYGVRSLLRARGFTLTAVLCLALGIAATSTAFGMVDVLFFRPPPGVGDPGGIVRPHVTVHSGGRLIDASGALQYPAYVEVRDHARPVAALAAMTALEVKVGTGATARKAVALPVTGNYFEVLRARPALGRYFTTAQDAGPGSPPVVVVSWAQWQGALGGARDVVGRRLLLSGHPYTIVAVAPKGFYGVEDISPALWVPLSRVGDFGAPREEQGLLTVARLAPGVARPAAEAQLGALFARALHLDSWGAGVRPGFTLGPIFSARGPVPETNVRVARWLALAAALVLVVACANLTNLLLARGVTRRKELALRLSLGARRARLVGQLLTESGLLALAGTTVGLLLAWWGTALLPIVGLPAVTFFARGRVLVFAVATATACVLVFGLVPALAGTAAAPAAALREGARQGEDRRSYVRSTLLVLQVALAALLLVGAGLFARSLYGVLAIRPGIDVERLLVVSPDLSGPSYGDSAAVAFYDRALDRLRHLPGVRAVSVAGAPPLSRGWEYRAYAVPDGTDRDVVYRGQEPTRAIALSVGAGYFATVGTPLLAGRDFANHDRAGAAPVVIVNRAFARYQWPGQRALDRCIDIGPPGSARCHRVVGVVADGRYAELEETARLAFFLPIAANRGGGRVLLVRAAGDPAALAPSVRRALAELQPGLPYVDLLALRDVLQPQLQPRWLGASALGVLALLALVLTAVGLYGVVSYGVAQRTHELGVRMALGARRLQVTLLVVRQGLRLTCAGLALGIAGAVASTRFVRHLLYGVAPTDTLTFVAVAVIVTATAALATLLPALRATRLDPVVALRAE